MVRGRLHAKVYETGIRSYDIHVGRMRETVAGVAALFRGEGSFFTCNRGFRLMLHIALVMRLRCEFCRQRS